MKTSLQVRLSQHLALTPQLQQSIRLLQLSTLELQQEVGQMLEANPFLEAEDDAPSAFEASLQASAQAEAAPPERLRDRGDDASAEASGTAADALSTQEAADGTGLGEADFGTTAQSDWENGTEADDFDGIRELPSLASPGAAGNRDDEDSPAEQDSGQITLVEHLQAQLAGMRLSGPDRAALQTLIDSLDEDGWLLDPIEDIARSLLGLPLDAGTPDGSDFPGDGGDDEASQSMLEELTDRLNCALKWLQSLDPVGVGARNLVECLSLQLRAMTPNPEQELALLIVHKHLDLLAKRDTKRLMAATGADEQDLRWAQQLIRQCEPKPGRAFARDVGAIVIPDVIVQRAGRGFRVVLNPDVMPRLRINELYAGALKGKGKKAPPLSSHLQQARYWLRAAQTPAVGTPCTRPACARSAAGRRAAFSPRDET